MNADDSLIQFLKKVRRNCCDRPHSKKRRRPGRGHFNGRLNNLFRSTSGFTGIELQRFSDDLEHGLFHALATAYAGWMLAGRGDINRQFVADIVLHDFLRGTRNCDEDHDQLLRAEFPMLSSAVFRHSNPLESDENKPLILGDRAELRRFPDHGDWLDLDRSPILGSELSVFYGSFRPALAFLWEHRDRCFYGHGPECSAPIDFKGPWPNRDRIDAGMVTASVEVDSPPFQKCGNHGGWATWGQIRAWKLLTNRNQLCNSNPIRDHLAVAENSRATEFIWVFMNAGKELSNFDSAIEAGVPVISRTALNQFFLTMRLIEEKLFALNIKSIGKA